MQQALVVFTGKTDIWWLKFLKSKYRHCFVLLNDGKSWVSIDPLAPFTEVKIHHHIEADYNLSQWLCDHGYVVTKATINHSHTRPAPFMFYSCVESVKRLLGIHEWRVITPWQLYKYLNKK